MASVDAHERPHSAETSEWRLRYLVGDLEHYTEWTPEFATVENYYDQYRRDERTSEVTIERRDQLERVIPDGGSIPAVESELYDDGFHTCPNCGGDLQYQSPEVTRCASCETEFSHYYSHDGTNNLFRAPEMDLAATVYDPADDQRRRDDQVVTDGGQDLVLVSTGHPKAYHRSKECVSMAHIADYERRPVSAVTVGPCKHCAAGDIDGEPASIDVCPECDGTNVVAVTGGMHTEAAEYDYACRMCGARMNELHTRERRLAESAGLGGLAGKLQQADPEDVSREHVREVGERA